MEETIVTLTEKIILLESVHTDNAHEHTVPDHDHNFAVIVGPPGKDGKSITGPAGKDGKGIIGPPGPPGKDGKSITGPAGKDGIDMQGHSHADEVKPTPIVEVEPIVETDHPLPLEHGYLCEKGKASKQPHRHTWNPINGCRDVLPEVPSHHITGESIKIKGY